MTTPLDDILEASTFNDVYAALRAEHAARPFQLPAPAAQLGRIVGGMFTILPAGEFAAPTAGRLLYEACVGFVLMAVDPAVSDDDRPLPWELINHTDTTPLCVAAMLLAVKPHMDFNSWVVLGSRLFTSWAQDMMFRDEDLDTLYTKYKEVASIE